MSSGRGDRSSPATVLWINDGRVQKRLADDEAAIQSMDGKRCMDVIVWIAQYLSRSNFQHA